MAKFTSLRWIASALVALALCAAQPASATTTGTKLCLDNLTGLQIRNIAAVVDNDKDWDGAARPDKNFNGVPVEKAEARCQHEELENKPPSAGFKLTLTLGDSSVLTLHVDQKDAITKFWKQIRAEGSASGTFNVWQTSGSQALGLYVQPRRAPDNSTWMADLLRSKPDIRMNQLIMPGSHDAGMFRAPKCSGFGKPDWTITQDTGVLGQLAAGSRYFDLRPYKFYSSDELYTAHYSFVGGCYGDSLASILDQVIQFMRGAGKGETVFLKLSHTQQQTPHKGQIESQVVSMVRARLGSLLYTSSAPTRNLSSARLADLAGHVVAVFDAEYKAQWNPGLGVMPYRDCDDKFCKQLAGYGLRVYDHYANDTGFDDMKNDQLVKMRCTGGFGNDYLFLLSWTLTGSTGNYDIKSLSARVNPELPRMAADIARGAIRIDDNSCTQNPQFGKPAYPEVFYYDFVDPNLSKVVIDMNK